MGSVFANAVAQAQPGAPETSAETRGTSQTHCYDSVQIFVDNLCSAGCTWDSLEKGESGANGSGGPRPAPAWPSGSKRWRQCTRRRRRTWRPPMTPRTGRSAKRCRPRCVGHPCGEVVEAVGKWHRRHDDWSVSRQRAVPRVRYLETSGGRDTSGCNQLEILGTFVGSTSHRRFSNAVAHDGPALWIRGWFDD